MNVSVEFWQLVTRSRRGMNYVAEENSRTPKAIKSVREDVVFVGLRQRRLEESRDICLISYKL